jgi:hypothetical protein
MDAAIGNSLTEDEGRTPEVQTFIFRPSSDFTVHVAHVAHIAHAGPSAQARRSRRSVSATAEAPPAHGDQERFANRPNSRTAEALNE